MIGHGSWIAIIWIVGFSIAAFVFVAYVIATPARGTRYVKESAVEQAVVAERERIRKAIHDLPTWPNERADDEWENPFVKMEDVVALFPVEVSG